MIKVSIVIPTYNRLKLLEEALLSVLAQDYEYWELLIVDDHSTDDTETIVNNYSLNDNRIKFLINNRTKGAQGARNTGIIAASGLFIILLDSDDLLDKHCLTKRLNFVKQQRGLDFYAFPTAIFNNEPFDTPYLWNYLNRDSDDLLRFLRQDMPFHTCGVLWKKESLIKLGLFDENLPCWQEWDIYVRALVYDLKYAKVNDLIANIDSFFRTNSEVDSISKKTKDIYHLNANTLLINKIVEIIKARNKLNTQTKDEIIKLAARHSFQLIVHHKITTNTVYWFQSVCRSIDTSMFTLKFWSFYLKHRFNKKLNIYLRKCLDISKIMKNKHLLSNHSTFGMAVYQK